ncbi:hypothetical protein LBMAG21_08040 [Armatimonadota bacterium]|nr:hypothetical protein LBMAG21_08040 [Armatimonadota bacterium]
MPELTPEERERIYLEEKERFEARQRLQSEVEVEQKTREAKQRYYQSLPPWKRPDGFTASFNTESKQSGVSCMTVFVFIFLCILGALFGGYVGLAIGFGLGIINAIQKR